jgi:hypothetical protein
MGDTARLTGLELPPQPETNANISPANTRQSIEFLWVIIRCQNPFPRMVVSPQNRLCACSK